MSTNKIEKMARTDAERTMAAEMFFGEGAGTRRKLLAAEMQPKLTMPGYYQAFDKAYDALDRSKYAQMAIKERQKLDRAAKAGQNLRALKSGNIRGLSNGVFIVAGVVYVAHVTGYDKIALKEGEKLYKKAKVEVKYRKARFQGRNVTKLA